MDNLAVLLKVILDFLFTVSHIKSQPPHAAVCNVKEFTKYF